jgi:AmmeMemoRadiSam system protein B
MTRSPVVAGQFYPGSRSSCIAELTGCLPANLSVETLPDRPLGGVVPHAGWFFSGKVAARVIAALAARRQPKTIVLFGAVHSWRVGQAAVYDAGRWATPIGEMGIDEALARRVTEKGRIAADPAAHQHEHSIEVQVPFVQHLLPDAKILPILVPPTDQAPEVGRVVAETVRDEGVDAAFVGSTDLTHYGPRYDYCPVGSDEKALAWAKDVNDRRFIDLMLSLDAESVVAEAQAHHNACGSGAVAATLSACRELGAAKGVLLEHTTSNEVMRKEGMGPSADAVGYAGVLFA